MNEFAKKELEQIRLEFDETILKFGEDRISVGYLKLRDKLESMIDLYDAKKIETWHCEKCEHVQ